jgi:hypothetical protein
MPYFILAFSIYLQPAAAAFLSYLQSIFNKKPILFIISKSILQLLLCTVFGFALTCIGKTRCSDELVADAYILQKKMPNTLASIPKEMWSDFECHAYLGRHCNISLDANRLHTYFIIKKDMPTTLVPSNYKKTDMPTQFLDVYLSK